MVFRNLIGNAIKHSDNAQSEIHVSCQSTGAFYTFSVADDGIGIAPEFHERIFGIFQTLKPRDDVEASGMGLALVKKIVQLYGGTVKLISDPAVQRGAVFQFTWPKFFGAHL
jgi:signal transduction histidine kinase